jgi:hypothetical protein
LEEDAAHIYLSEFAFVNGEEECQRHDGLVIHTLRRRIPIVRYSDSALKSSRKEHIYFTHEFKRIVGPWREK